MVGGAISPSLKNDWVRAWWVQSCWWNEVQWCSKWRDRSRAGDWCWKRAHCPLNHFLRYPLVHFVKFLPYMKWNIKSVETLNHQKGFHGDFKELHASICSPEKMPNISNQDGFEARQLSGRQHSGIIPASLWGLLWDKNQVPSGKHTKSHWKWSFIVDLPMKKGGSFHSFFLLTITRGWKPKKARPHLGVSWCWTSGYAMGWPAPTWNLPATEKLGTLSDHRKQSSKIITRQ